MKTKQKGFAWIGAMALGLVIFLCAGLLGTVGMVRGEESQAARAAITQYTVSYATGAPAGSAMTFTPKTGVTTLAVDASGCVTLPTTFSETVTVGGMAANQKLDVETFYFDAYSQSAVEAGSLWAYTFTGWQIAGTDKKIAGETVLQPGFVIPPEVLESYASNGSLELVALWGKCYFIQNPYENMVYEAIDRYYPTKSGSTYSWASAQITAVNTATSTGRTNAYDYAGGVGNAGNNPNAPLATVAYLYSLLDTAGDPYDACATAVVLTGDLDYIKDQNANYTFNETYATNAGPLTVGGTQVAVADVVRPASLKTEFHCTDSAGYLYHMGQSRAFGTSTGVDGKTAAGVTFKSLQKTEGTVYNFFYKVFDDEGQFYSSIRFDNVCLNARVDESTAGTSTPTFMKENLGYNCRIYDSTRSSTSATNNAHDGTQYFETTARMTCSPLAGTGENARRLFPFSTLRSHDCETVVLSSGFFTYLNASWGDAEDEMERHWYVGGSAFANQVYPGLVNSASAYTIAGDVYLTVTGGRINEAYGGGNGASNKHEGNRYYRFYGDTTHAPTLSQIYGGAVDGTMTGDVDILVKNCTVGSTLCGGGKNYTATVTGNATVSLEGSTVSGDVYGGGLYGACEGDVSLRLSGSKVTGTIYGSGRGNSNIVTTTIDLDTGGTAPEEWDTAPTGFPVRNADGSVTSAVYRQLSWTSGHNNTTSGIRWSETTDVYALSMASVENVQITIADSQVQDVFGGGAFAIVNGDTSIAITGSTTVSGSVYGGGNGEGDIQTVPLYGPIAQDNYKAPYPVINGDSANFNNGQYQALTTSANNKTLVKGTSLGSYTWSDDASLFTGTPGQDDFTGINHDKKLIYYNAAEVGVVAGDTSISISDTASVSGAVYGGGNKGSVQGSTEISVSGTATAAYVYGGGNQGAVQGSTEISVSGTATAAYVYGGGNQGAVQGSTDVSLLETATVSSAVYGGGNAGTVAQSATVNISGGTVSGTVFGGGNAGNVSGQATVNISGGDLAGVVYGGGDHGTVGSTLVHITASQFTGKRVYGGGNEGAVTGAARVTATGTTFPTITSGASAYIYGGGNAASVGSVELTLTDVVIDRPQKAWATVKSVYDGAVYGGGNAGQVLGNITVVLSNTELDANLYGGGNAAAARVGGNITITATDLQNASGNSATVDKPEYNLYGGGRSADVAGNVTITITDGEFDWIYGGGQSGDVGNINMTLNGTGKAAADNSSYNQPVVNWCLRGGGNAGDAKAVRLTVNDGWVRRNTHVGGSAGVCDSTYTVINGGQISTLFGGGDSGAVLGLCYLEINSMSTQYSIYGGGDQASSRVGQTHVVVNDPDLVISSGNAIYGGSDQGWVVGKGLSTSAMQLSGSVYSVNEGAANLTFTGDGSTKVEFKAGTSPAVYGGSNGTPDSNTSGTKDQLGSVAGNSTLIISGGTVTNAYGGNNAAGITGGSTNLTVSGGTVTNAYGGNNAGGTITGTANTTVSGGAVTSAYGGNNNGGVVSGGARLNIKGGTVKYGFGGCNASGTVYGTVQTHFSGGTVSSNLYGGGNLAPILAGTADSVEVYISEDAYAFGTGVWVYGGGNEADCEVPVYVEVSGGQVYWLAGGGKAAACVSTEVLVSGGKVSSLWGGGDDSTSSVSGDTHVTITGGTVYSCVRGGGNLGSVSGSTYVEISGGSADHINGGGNKGVVGGSSYVTISGGSVADVYGGGDSGENEPAVVKGDTKVTVSGGTVTGMICGGGNRAWSTVEGSTLVEITGGTVTTVYGGGNAGPVNGSSAVTVSQKAAVSENVYGGGNAGVVEGDSSVTMDGGTVALDVFGGGRSASVPNASVQLSGGTVEGAVYGGGQEGAVSGRASVIVDGGFATTVYGGGQEGTVGTTDVQILDDASVSGNVYGGGEGVNATVKGKTTVSVNMNYDFQVTETPITTTHITPSGMVHSSVVVFASAEYGYIGGNVYGGGDLARVGDGTISAGGDKATISILGKTSVTVENGAIAGSVFGGGRGIPESGDYNFYMGAVFGSTEVTIHGGLIGSSQAGGSVYGGGEQSRVYTVGGEGTACTVSVVESEGKKIAINGSVFGGGDRGESATANASVPTVYGNVYVLIQGIKDHKPSNIYFLAGLDGSAASGGGVYGDGNLCLVEGYRQIKLLDFEPASNEDGSTVKTFYSLQRADEAILENSAVVLLGAPDLVEEGDTGLYSINRIGKLSLQSGSVVKLDQVVKYLGGISSDVHPTQRFIHDGTNGRTGTYDAWTSCTCRELNTENHTCGCLEPLTQALIDAYRDETGDHTDEDKNVVCVANGLYLEILDETGTYGPVTGLFTLQLLYANPGEGGGFVYGSIPESIGDFICETLSWTFTTSTGVTAENFDALMAENDGLFVRVAGKAFQRATTYSDSQTYYTRESTNSYMEIIDDVGGVLANDAGYTYYYWYIGGPSVTYQVELTGYIGASATEFATNTTLPQHDSKRAYVLYSVSVNNALEQAITGGTYELARTAEVSGQQIAIELRLGGQSLGFLVRQDDGTWGVWANGSALTGYNGDKTLAADNTLYTGTVGAANDRMTWVLHKADTVSTTAAELEVYLDVDLFEATDGGVLENVTTGTAMLSYTASISIVRLTASQALYHDNLRSYTGVATHSTIHITGNSSFSAEYQTRYVPAAYPGGAGDMVWALTTQSSTYFMASDGAYFTVDSQGKLYNFSEGLSESDLTLLSNGNYERTSDKAVFSPVESFSAPAIPKNTKITLVDLSGTVPTYYYYICDSEKTYISLDDFKQMGTLTTIGEMAEEPGFMAAYAQQDMAVYTERLLFVFDFEQAQKDAAEFSGGLVLAHRYQNVDILDYARQDAAGDYVRSLPKSITYKFHGGETGVVADSYTAAFQADSYSDIGTAVLRVHVEEDDDWINTLFRENGFALKIQLVDENGKPISMPAGMYFEYKGQYYYPGPDSTFIAVPVHEFGDHEIILHNPSFSLSAVVGDTAYFKTSYFSAPDAGYYNAFDTGVAETDSYALTAAASYHLKVVAAGDQVLTAGQALDFTCTAQTDGQGETVSVTAWVKTETGYVPAEWDSLFEAAPQTLADGAALACSWQTGSGAAPGTYRLIFTYGGHTEYLNLIVK